MPKIVIKPDYVPKLKQKDGLLKLSKVNTITQICPRCNDAIPANEMNEHMRIELLDPRWKEQRKRYLEKQKNSNVLEKGTDISKNLKKLAEYRQDIFGGDVMESERKIQEENIKAVEKSKAVWDGHANTIGSVTAKATISIEEHITVLNKAIQKKEATAIGPRPPVDNSSSGTPPQLLPFHQTNPHHYYIPGAHPSQHFNSPM